MREIKFMAYIKSLKWTLPVLRIDFESKEIEVDLTNGNGDTAYYDFSEVEIMQYTGLKDKNDKGIYEGYIIRHGGYQDMIDAVEFGDGCFYTTGSSLHLYCCSNIEVIGNIYENPELPEEQSG